MEFFYREMRRKSGVLMDGTEPEGGRWNFDAENRKQLWQRTGRDCYCQSRIAFPPDAITREVIGIW